MRSFALALTLSVMLAASTGAGQEVVMDAGRLAHSLDRLSSTARVLYIAAHPDDENTRLLAHLANARHVTVAYLSMTRGGGGQNLIGREQDSLLDALRTQELLAARRLDGAQQRFTRMRDFGFSKSAEETLGIWGHDEALADVVFALRDFRPDVVISRFDEKLPNHGHHTASFLLAREAFSAAADVTRFAEQLALGLKPWQASRLVINVPRWREGEIPKDALTIDVGGYDTRLGLSYGELAARSRSEHKSQGFGASPERGVLNESFVHVAGARAQRDLLEGVALDWSRYGVVAAGVDSALKAARQQLHRDHPERAIPSLLAARRALAALPGDDPRVRDAQLESERLALAASGLFVRATASQPRCTPGGLLPVKLEIVRQRETALALRKVTFPDGQVRVPATPLALHERVELSAEVRCPKDAPVSSPYWLREPALPGRHVVSDLRALSDPEGPAPLEVSVDLQLEATQLTLRAPLLHAWTDRVQGERERRVLVVPPATVTPTRDAFMFPNGKRTSVSLRVRAGVDGASGRILLELPSGWRAEPAEQAITFAHAGDERVVDFAVTPAKDARDVIATPVVEVAGQRYSYREDLIDYPHVPLQMVLQPAKLRLSPVELKRPRGLIGYVEGPGDTVAADLVHVGTEVETLSDATLLQGDLERFSAIVLGVRAYNTRDVLRAAQPRLMRYVELGGTVVTQYVTRSSLSPLDVPVGPYSLEIGRGRVTDERAAVRVLRPEDAILRTPNRIGDKDFVGWVQERGLYFGERWDPRYVPLLELADPAEAAQQGALLVARHGRGRYIYTGLSFFRQLPAGVPGAYRLFVNLLAREAGSTP